MVMKIYSKKQPKKSWAIELRIIPHASSTCVAIVDADTGEFITKLIVFEGNGLVFLSENVYMTLVNGGYNPNEHGNHFDSKGRIIISMI